MSMNVPGMNFMKSQWSDTMVQHSVYAAVVFLICAHPEVFKFVDKHLSQLVRTVDKGFRLDGNLLLFIHACVVALLMYFGTVYVFTPFSQLVQGFSKGPKPAQKPAQKPKPASKVAPKRPVKQVGKAPSPGPTASSIGSPL